MRRAKIQKLARKEGVANWQTMRFATDMCECDASCDTMAFKSHVQGLTVLEAFWTGVLTTTLPPNLPTCPTLENRPLACGPSRLETDDVFSRLLRTRTVIFKSSPAAPLVISLLAISQQVDCNFPPIRSTGTWGAQCCVPFLTWAALFQKHLNLVKLDGHGKTQKMKMETELKKKKKKTSTGMHRGLQFQHTITPHVRFSSRCSILSLAYPYLHELIRSEDGVAAIVSRLSRSNRSLLRGAYQCSCARGKATLAVDMVFLHTGYFSSTSVD